MIKIFVFFVSIFCSLYLYANAPSENTVPQKNETVANIESDNKSIKQNKKIDATKADEVDGNTEINNNVNVDDYGESKIAYGMPVTEKSIEKADIPTKESMVSQIGMGLFVIVAIIFGLSWLAKKVGINQFAHKEGFKVLNTLPLGGKEKVVLIDVNGEHVLLGVAPGSVNYIKSINRNDNNSRAIFNSEDNKNNTMSGMSEEEKKTIEHAEQNTENNTVQGGELNASSRGFSHLLQQHRSSPNSSNETSSVVVDFSSYLRKILMRKK